MLIINIGRSTVSSAVKIANHPNSVPEVSSFDALISAVPVFPAKRMSSRWAAYQVPLESFTTFFVPSNTRLAVSLEKAPGIQYSATASF